MMGTKPKPPPYPKPPRPPAEPPRPQPGRGGDPFKIKTPSEDERLRWFAFHNLLTWAEAMVKQRNRLDAGVVAIRKMAKQRRLKPIARARLVRQRGRPLRAFNVERHLFINSAHQLMQYRKWVGRLGILSNDFFREIDKFGKSVNTQGQKRACHRVF
jgi:hypothetical protein